MNLRNLRTLTLWIKNSVGTGGFHKLTIYDFKFSLIIRSCNICTHINDTTLYYFESNTGLVDGFYFSKTSYYVHEHHLISLFELQSVWEGDIFY